MNNVVNIPTGATGYRNSIVSQARSAQRTVNKMQMSPQLNTKGFVQPLGKITNSASEFQKSMDASAARVFAFGAAVGVINGISDSFKALVVSAAEVEKSLKDVQVVMEASNAQMKEFGKGIFDVARNTASSFDTVAQSAIELARQGLSAEETISRVNSALVLSRLSGLDAVKSTEALTAAINSFNKEGVTHEQIVNRMANVDASFAVSSADLAEAISRAGAVAQSSGVSFNELAAIVTAVQQRTARGGSVIGNGFKSIFTRIKRSGVRESLEEIGVSTKKMNGDFRSSIDILKDYAAVYKNLSDAQKSYTSEQIAGVFQIQNLQALLQDLNSGYSVYNKALGVANNTTTQATDRNKELNETLSAVFTQTSLGAKELAARLGELAVSDSFKDILKAVGKLAEFLNKALDENQGSDFAKNLVKGFGSFITGPGLVIIGAAFIKVFALVGKFAKEAFSDLLGVNRETKRQQGLQSAIGSILLNNAGVYNKILQAGANTAKQEQIILSVIRAETAERVKQEALIRKIASSRALTGIGVSEQGFIPAGKNSRKGKKTLGLAGGFLPAIDRESLDISRGVGGAKGGDKPVVLPSHKMGGGRTETVVAHTGEWIVPNFGGSGGDAIFNRAMAQSMGLPSGARQITAASGLVPNFAVGKSSKKVSRPSLELGWRENGNSQLSKKTDFNDTISANINTFKQPLSASGAKREAKEKYTKILQPQLEDSKGNKYKSFWKNNKWNNHEKINNLSLDERSDLKRSYSINRENYKSFSREGFGEMMKSAPYNGSKKYLKDIVSQEGYKGPKQPKKLSSKFAALQTNLSGAVGEMGGVKHLQKIGYKDAKIIPNAGSFDFEAKDKKGRKVLFEGKQKEKQNISEFLKKGATKYLRNIDLPGFKNGKAERINLNAVKLGGSNLFPGGVNAVLSSSTKLNNSKITHKDYGSSGEERSKYEDMVKNIEKIWKNPSVNEKTKEELRDSFDLFADPKSKALKSFSSGFIPNFDNSKGVMTSKGYLNNRQIALLKRNEGTYATKSDASKVRKSDEKLYMNMFSKEDLKLINSVESKHSKKNIAVAKDKSREQKNKIKTIDASTQATMLVASNNVRRRVDSTVSRKDAQGVDRKTRLKYRVEGIKSNKLKDTEVNLRNRVESLMKKESSSLASQISGVNSFSGNNAKITQLANAGSVGSAAGSIFETALKSISNNKLFTKNNARFDIAGFPDKKLQSLFGYSTPYADAKIGYTKGTKEDFDSKVLALGGGKVSLSKAQKDRMAAVSSDTRSNFGPARKGSARRAASGFIPNFARGISNKQREKLRDMGVDPAGVSRKKYRSIVLEQSQKPKQLKPGGFKSKSDGAFQNRNSNFSKNFMSGDSRTKRISISAGSKAGVVGASLASSSKTSLEQSLASLTNRVSRLESKIQPNFSQGFIPNFSKKEPATLNRLLRDAVSNNVGGVATENGLSIDKQKKLILKNGKPINFGNKAHVNPIINNEKVLNSISKDINTQLFEAQKYGTKESILQRLGFSADLDKNKAKVAQDARNMAGNLNVRKESGTNRIVSNDPNFTLGKRAPNGEHTIALKKSAVAQNIKRLGEKGFSGVGQITANNLLSTLSIQNTKRGKAGGGISLKRTLETTSKIARLIKNKKIKIGQRFIETKAAISKKMSGLVDGYNHNVMTVKEKLASRKANLRRKEAARKESARIKREEKNLRKLKDKEARQLAKGRKLEEKELRQKRDLERKTEDRRIRKENIKKFGTWFTDKSGKAVDVTRSSLAKAGHGILSAGRGIKEGFLRNLNSVAEKKSNLGRQIKAAGLKKIRSGRDFVNKAQDKIGSVASRFSPRSLKPKIENIRERVKEGSSNAFKKVSKKFSSISQGLQDKFPAKQSIQKGWTALAERLDVKNNLSKAGTSIKNRFNFKREELAYKSKKAISAGIARTRGAITSGAKKIKENKSKILLAGAASLATLLKSSSVAGVAGKGILATAGGAKIGGGIIGAGAIGGGLALPAGVLAALGVTSVGAGLGIAALIKKVQKRKREIRRQKREERRKAPPLSISSIFDRDIRGSEKHLEKENETKREIKNLNKLINQAKVYGSGEEFKSRGYQSAKFDEAKFNKEASSVRIDGRNRRVDREKGTKGRSLNVQPSFLDRNSQLFKDSGLSELTKKRDWKRYQLSILNGKYNPDIGVSKKEWKINQRSYMMKELFGDLEARKEQAYEKRQGSFLFKNRGFGKAQGIVDWASNKYNARKQNKKDEKKQINFRNFRRGRFSSGFVPNFSKMADLIQKRNQARAARKKSTNELAIREPAVKLSFAGGHPGKNPLTESYVKAYKQGKLSEKELFEMVNGQARMLKGNPKKFQDQMDYVAANVTRAPGQIRRTKVDDMRSGAVNAADGYIPNFSIAQRLKNYAASSMGMKGSGVQLNTRMNRWLQTGSSGSKKHHLLHGWLTKKGKLRGEQGELMQQGVNRMTTRDFLAFEKHLIQNRYVHNLPGFSNMVNKGASAISGEARTGFMSSGFIPNFSNKPLAEAISRESTALKQRGLSQSLIRIDQHNSLKSGKNPRGLAITNKVDEPAGINQGISMSKKSGVDPKKHGMVPNFSRFGSFGNRPSRKPKNKKDKDEDKNELPGSEGGGQIGLASAFIAPMVSEQIRDGRQEYEMDNASLIGTSAANLAGYGGLLGGVPGALIGGGVGAAFGASKAIFEGNSNSLKSDLANKMVEAQTKINKEFAKYKTAENYAGALSDLSNATKAGDVAGIKKASAQVQKALQDLKNPSLVAELSTVGTGMDSFGEKIKILGSSMEEAQKKTVLLKESADTMAELQNLETKGAGFATRAMMMVPELLSGFSDLFGGRKSGRQINGTGLFGGKITLGDNQNIDEARVSMEKIMPSIVSATRSDFDKEAMRLFKQQDPFINDPKTGGKYKNFSEFKEAARNKINQSQAEEQIIKLKSDANLLRTFEGRSDRGSEKDQSRVLNELLQSNMIKDLVNSGAQGATIAKGLASNLAGVSFDEDFDFASTVKRGKRASIGIGYQTSSDDYVQDNQLVALRQQMLKEVKEIQGNMKILEGAEGAAAGILQAMSNIDTDLKEAVKKSERLSETINNFTKNFEFSKEVKTKKRQQTMSNLSQGDDILFNAGMISEEEAVRRNKARSDFEIRRSGQEELTSRVLRTISENADPSSVIDVIGLQKKHDVPVDKSSGGTIQRLEKEQERERRPEIQEITQKFAEFAQSQGTANMGLNNIAGFLSQLNTGGKTNNNILSEVKRHIKEVSVNTLMSLQQNKKANELLKMRTHAETLNKLGSSIYNEGTISQVRSAVKGGGVMGAGWSDATQEEYSRKDYHGGPLNGHDVNLRDGARKGQSQMFLEELFGISLEKETGRSKMENKKNTGLYNLDLLKDILPPDLFDRLRDKIIEAAKALEKFKKTQSEQYEKLGLDPNAMALQDAAMKQLVVQTNMALTLKNIDAGLTKRDGTILDVFRAIQNLLPTSPPATQPATPTATATATATATQPATPTATATASPYNAPSPTMRDSRYSLPAYSQSTPPLVSQGNSNQPPVNAPNPFLPPKPKGSRGPNGNPGPGGQPGGPELEGVIRSNEKLIQSIDTNKTEFRQNAEQLNKTLGSVAERTETSFKSLESSMIVLPEAITNLPSQIASSISEAVFNHSITGNIKVDLNTEEVKKAMGEAMWENWQEMLSDTTIRIAMAHAVQGFIKIRKNQII